jgi:hypothetical protein
MKARLQAIVARREALVRASDSQRELLALQASAAQRTLWFVEPAARAGRTVASHPLLVAVAAGVLVALAPRRLLAGGSRAAVLLVSAWRLGSSLRALRRE